MTSPEPDKMVYSKVPQSLVERLQAHAKANDRTLSAEVRIAMRERLKRLDEEQEVAA